MPSFLFGTVAEDGSVGNAGSGDLSSSRIDTGVYHVRFNAALSSIPAVVLTCHLDDNNTIATMEIATDYFVVHSKQTGTTFDDTPFSFIAIANDD